MERRITAPREVLAELREDFSLCGKCKLCQAVMAQQCEDPRFWRNCPAGTRFRFEPYYASGKMEVARCMDLAEIEPDETMKHVLYTCMTCGSCDDRCWPVKQLHPMRVIELLREVAVQDEWAPMEFFSEMLANVEKTDNIYGTPAAKRVGWAKDLKIKDALAEKVEYLLMVGDEYCSFPSMAPRMRAVAGAMQAAGLDFGTLGKEEITSGAALLSIGDRDFFETVAARNIELIEKSGAKKVVTADPHVHWVLSEEYTKAIDVEVFHVSELLDSAIKAGTLKPSKEVKVKAIYHDPCKLGRRSGIFEEPRAVLEAIPGLELVEFERARKNALCCGGGGGVYLWEQEYSAWVTDERLFEAEWVGADALVSACPLCVRLFEEGVKKRGSKMAVYDLCEILEKSL